MSMGFGVDGPGLLFSIFPFLFIAVFVLIIGMFIVNAVRGVSTWSKNNASPKLTVPARVVTKRTSVTSRRHLDDGIGHSTASTHYYATFQVESGDRMEFSVSGPEYGLLAEGDQGSLTFQGTRYLGFERA
ncbi:MAG: DUF2500 domain-containing protein [Dysosmobacter sp.]|nr:DUF2500 domain-containing protein [Dysosmobacter sp.]